MRVNFGVAITQILEFNGKEQYLKTRLWLRQVPVLESKGMQEPTNLRANLHRASAATLASLLTLPLPFEYIVMLGNGSGTDFQVSPCHRRPALAVDAAAASDARCGYTPRVVI